MPIQLKLGLEVIHSYKRLAYTPWHAIAEFVDNSTQSYFNNRKDLDIAYGKVGEQLTIGIVYDRPSGLLRISDNAMGMSPAELTKALIVGIPPDNTSGRSKYGMGMKTAACWLGNKWTIRTKRLMAPQEHTITIDVAEVGSGNNDLPHSINEKISKDLHYTVIEISNLNQNFHGRTQGKIQDFLRSMYRQDLRNGNVSIEWQGNPLRWDDSDYHFLSAPDGTNYKREFSFAAAGRDVHGWVGVLSSGGRARAGFSVLNADRVVKGWPDSWRPETLYGQLQGSNDLVNQRLVGEIHLDGFEVSHTKDDILWFGDEEDEVQERLKEICAEYVAVAKTFRKRGETEGGPTQLETEAAIDELKRELSTGEIRDIVALEEVPTPDSVHQMKLPLVAAANSREPTYTANMGNLEVLGYLMDDGSFNDPYVAIESTRPGRVMIMINTSHPHWSQLQGSEGVLNYLRHCTYDAIAEWKARAKSAALDPDTIKILKDGLLRNPVDLKMAQEEPVTQATG